MFRILEKNFKRKIMDPTEQPMDEEELLWKARIGEERAQEILEWKMISEQQLLSQIERVKLTLDRQKKTNIELARHEKALDQQIKGLHSVLSDLQNS